MKTKLTNQNPSANANGTVAILLIAILAIAYTGWSFWSTEKKKEKEARLIFVGNQYKAAIGRYYESSPGQLRQFPRRLEDLVADGRTNPKGQYLAELYDDPMGTSWGLIKDAEGGITGVRSMSDERPSSDVDARPAEFLNSETYAEWKFQYDPPTTLAHPVAAIRNAEIVSVAPMPPAIPVPVEQVAEDLPVVERSESLSLRRLPQPVGQIDVDAIQLGSGVPGIPPLAQESDRRRRVCIVNATRYATACVNQPDVIGSQDAIRTCVVDAQQRYEQCGGV